MEQIIYSKFSNERNRELAIRTDIFRDEKHNRIVRKTPIFSEGVTHVTNLLKWEEQLSDKYRNTCVTLNHGVRSGNSICFEYLEGDTLETMLDSFYFKGKYDELLEMFGKYVDTIRSVNGTQKFRYTQEFEKIFGNVELGTDLMAGNVNNIDMVAGNIIVAENTWNIIDYEWTFNFPIPVNFIIFRTIFYYVYATARREELQQIGFYKIFGISEKEQKAYMQMEQNFQKYIISENVPIRDMYQRISKGTVELDRLLELKKEIEEERKIQIYFDYGNGFSEQDSEWVYLDEVSNDTSVLKMSLQEGIKGLRIDPAEHPCIMQIYKILGKADYIYELEFVTNGRKAGKNLYLFTDEDPWMQITNLRTGTTQISIEVKKETLERNFAEGIQLDIDKINIEQEKQLQRLGELEKNVAEQNEQVSQLNQQLYSNAQTIIAQGQTIGDLNHRLYLAEASFHEIQGSFCWKITKPIRIIGKLIRNFFQRHYSLKGFLRNIKRFLTMGPTEMREFNRKERIEKRSFHILDEISVTCDLEELERQRKEVFDEPIKFSVIVPLYNTPEIYLRKMIESVLYQTYGNLELCLADGSDKAHRYVKNICKEYYYYDKRIHYKKLKKNLGISDNTNACLAMSEGDYIVLFDHDDFLHPSALYENRKVIEDKKADFLYSDENTFHETINDAFNPHYKPDFAPDTLRSNNYICHLSVFSRKLYEKVGGFRKDFDGSQDYDMILRLTEQADCVAHIPKVLYYWRAHAASVAMDIHAKDYCIVSARKALSEHLKRMGMAGEVENSKVISTYRIKYELKDKPLISILIPNCDHKNDLEKCLNSLYEKTTYENFEIIIIENNSVGNEIADYYKELEEKHADLKIVEWKDKFNYAAINNFGAQFAKGEYLILLNNDVEIITNNWIEEMLMYTQREEVGATGVKLLYPDGTLQHMGVYLGVGGVAGHCMKGISREDPGYFGRASFVQNVSCVTAACMMISKKVFQEMSGFDEKYEVAFNDVDLCMRIRRAGYLIVVTPYAELYHYESKSRGTDEEPEKRARFVSEVKRFQKQWRQELIKGDPYYNPNFSLVHYNYSIKEADEPSLWIV